MFSIYRTKKEKKGVRKILIIFKIFENFHQKALAKEEKKADDTPKTA